MNLLKMSAHDYPSWHILKLVYLPIKRLNFHKNVGFFFFQTIATSQVKMWKSSKMVFGNELKAIC